MLNGYSGTGRSTHGTDTSLSALVRWYEGSKCAFCQKWQARKQDSFSSGCTAGTLNNAGKAGADSRKGSVGRAPGLAFTPARIALGNDLGADSVCATGAQTTPYNSREVKGKHMSRVVVFVS